MNAIRMMARLGILPKPFEYVGAGGGGGTETTVTGVSPLLLTSAVAKAIKSLVQYGKCTQASTPTPSAPQDIVCNNGALRMLNLANMAESNLDIGFYLNNNGVRTAGSSNFYTLGFIPVKPSTTYTMGTSASLNYYNIMEYDSAQGFLKRTLWGSSGSPAGDTTTFTTRSDTAYLRFGSNMTGSALTYADIAAVTWMLTEGETAQDYVPYGQLSVVGTPEVLTVSADGAETQTVTDIPNLFAVGDYADEGDIISGGVKRKVGIKVFDGTESFSKSGALYIHSAADKATTKSPVLCSHFSYFSGSTSGAADGDLITHTNTNLYFKNGTTATLEAWRAFLAAQYAAGTPVIVIYPLAEETEETVTPQPLNTTAGDNVVSVTSNVDPVTLEATYYAKT